MQMRVNGAHVEVSQDGINWDRPTLEEVMRFSIEQSRNYGRLVESTLMGVEDSWKAPG